MVDIEPFSPPLTTRNQTWDPDGSIKVEKLSKYLSHHLSYVSGINDVLIGDAVGEWEEDYGEIENSSRTELDTHANILVVGSECYIIAHTGKTAKVHPYRPDYEAKDIPIIHVAVQYDCPYTGERYVLVIRNALYVPVMKNNLIPPFIIREAGVQVLDTPKIHIKDPMVDDHSLYFGGTNFRVPLQSWGVFSYFNTSKPSTKTMVECDEVYLLTPKSWDPHTDVHERNKRKMLDYKGEMVPRDKRKQILLKDVQADPAIQTEIRLSTVEEKWVDGSGQELQIFT